MFPLLEWVVLCFAHWAYNVLYTRWLFSKQLFSATSLSNGIQLHVFSAIVLIKCKFPVQEQLISVGWVSVHAQ